MSADKKKSETQPTNKELSEYTADAWNNLRNTWIQYLKINKEAPEDGKKAENQKEQLETIIERLLGSLKIEHDIFRKSGFDARDVLSGDPKPKIENTLSNNNTKNGILIPAAVIATIAIVVTSFALSYSKIFMLENAVWISAITVGASSVVILLIHTTNLKRAKQFSRLPVYQFLALTVLIVCMVAAISFLPTIQSAEDLPISRTVIELGNSTAWYLSVGEKEVLSSPEQTGKPVEEVVLQIPYYIIIPGLLGAYIRYLYKDIRSFRQSLKKDLEQFKQYSLDYKNKIFEIALAIDVGIDKIQESLPQEKKLKTYVTLQDLLNVCRQRNAYIYSLPPEAVTKFSHYLKNRFSQLAVLETKYQKQQFTLGEKTNHKTLAVIGAFFLAPLLAIVGWLIAGLSGEINKEALIIVAFGAGMSADAIVKKMWEFTGEKLNADDDSESKVKIDGFTVEPQEGDAPLNVQFTLKISGEHKEIKWNFGDNNTDTGGLTKTHTYETEGQFSGKVSVVDMQDNTEEKGFTVKVTKSEQPEQ